MQITHKHWLFFYFSITIFSLFLFLNYTKTSSQNLQIHYLDIGQGDATLIITPENQKILIDTGPIGNLNQKFKEYVSYFEKEIDLLILTHPDSDHIGGIFDVLKIFEIKEMVLSQNIHQNADFQRLLQIIKSKNIPTLFANQNTDLRIGKNVFIDFLYPFKNSSNQEQNSFSNSSLVLKILYGQQSFLFTGDAEIKQEKLITLSQQNIKADIYQAGHHGSKTSSSTSFLQAIQPKITIVSAAKDNSFGHPHQEILDRFKSFGIEIYQTLEEGDISLYSNGIKTWKNNN